MRRFLLAVFLVAQAHAQNSKDATDLLQKTKAYGEQIKNWRAESTKTSQVVGPGINIKEEIRTKFASKPPLLMSRVNSGDDRTMMICDGVNHFYSGDAGSYYKNEATQQQCNLLLADMYEPALKQLLEPSGGLVSLSVLGDDHVPLTDGERSCVVIRAALKQGPLHTVRTMCIDPARPIILRDNYEAENQASGVKFSTTTTVTNFEVDPDFSPDTFQFKIPPSALEAFPPSIPVNPSRPKNLSTHPQSTR